MPKQVNITVFDSTSGSILNVTPKNFLIFRNISMLYGDNLPILTLEMSSGDKVINKNVIGWCIVSTAPPCIKFN
jgi:hypothetical protein